MRRDMWAVREVGGEVWPGVGREYWWGGGVGSCVVPRCARCPFSPFSPVGGGYHGGRWRRRSGW